MSLTKNQANDLIDIHLNAYQFDSSPRLELGDYIRENNLTLTTADLETLGFIAINIWHNKAHPRWSVKSMHEVSND